MKFDRLLWSRLLPGIHEWEDPNTPEKQRFKVRLEPEMGEAVLFFDIDSPEFRDNQPNIPVCDLLIFFRGPLVSRPVLLFAELKGSDVQKAEVQLLSSIERVVDDLSLDCFSESMSRRDLTRGGSSEPEKKNWRREKFVAAKRVIIRAVVVSGPSVPSTDDRVRRKKLSREQGIRFYYEDEARGKRIVNLRPFLP